MKYVGYYDTEANKSENRVYFLPATHKMDYVMSALNALGHDVEIISASFTRNHHGHAGRAVSLGRGNSLRLFRTLPWGNRLRRVASRVFTRAALCIWLILNTSRGEPVLVYHSLGYGSSIIIGRLLRRFRLVLEVEEVYSDVSGSPRERRAEQRAFRHADAFIFPTILLDGTLNHRERPFAVAHGSYLIEKERGVSFDDGRVHVVYAGTFDFRKQGAASAIEAARHLGSRYHVHIIGFGSASDEERILSMIDEVNTVSDCVVSYDGLLAGEDYVRFIQRCHIGLSTQRLDAEFGETSFPSKVLSYMANGLRVVTIRLRVLEESGVDDLLSYYDVDEPEAIAQAIMEVDMNLPYDSRSRLKDLNMHFVEALDSIVGD